ncbi:hypothetical protein [Dysgonomonas massiliensis]|uniref:hypothetical protein n=1 Tax=Dysgonomonas massiliensis TaxID=2040292 RepID=UPI000C793096|nr:hypothetical protein [Dysgonomonas massiliensis]
MNTIQSIFTILVDGKEIKHYSTDTAKVLKEQIDFFLDSATDESNMTISDENSSIHVTATALKDSVWSVNSVKQPIVQDLFFK